MLANLMFHSDLRNYRRLIGSRQQIKSGLALHNHLRARMARLNGRLEVIITEAISLLAMHRRATVIDLNAMERFNL